MLVIEIALGIVLAVLILRALPSLVAGAMALVVVGIAVGLVVALAVFIYSRWQEVATVLLTLGGMLAVGALIRFLEARTLFTVDEMFLVIVSFGLALLFSAGCVSSVFEYVRSTETGFLIVALGSGLLVLPWIFVARAMVRRASRRRADQGQGTKTAVGSGGNAT